MSGVKAWFRGLRASRTAQEAAPQGSNPEDSLLPKGVTVVVTAWRFGIEPGQSTADVIEEGDLEITPVPSGGGVLLRSNHFHSAHPILFDEEDGSQWMPWWAYLQVWAAVAPSVLELWGDSDGEDSR